MYDLKKVTKKYFSLDTGNPLYRQEVWDPTDEEWEEFEMWGWLSPEAIARIPVTPNQTVDAETVLRNRQKAEMEKQINEEGVGVCAHCGEEIRKNEALVAGGWTWESEYMLGWCDKSGDRKHKPKIVLQEKTEQ